MSRLGRSSAQLAAVLIVILMTSLGLVGSASASTPIKSMPIATAANTLEFTYSMSSFLAERKKPTSTRDGRFDWSTDGCSSPGSGLASWDKTFANPCLRHDFGYRNFGPGGPGGVVIATETQRKRIDDKFLSDMKTVCNAKPIYSRPTCTFMANNYYTAVRVGGKSSYFN